MALINQNSIIGITSITSPSASNVLTVHTNDTTERLRVSTSGLSFSGTNASLDTSGNISAVDGTFTGNVSIGGTLTYEDVTNIDAVGIITAQAGIRVTGGSVGIGTDSPVTMLEVGNQSQTMSGAITVSNGEALGGGTGPVINLKHGPAGGTQRTHQIYSYIGDLRIVADSNENMEFHTGGTESLRINSVGDLFVAGTGGMNTTQLPNGSTININGNSSNDGFSIIRYSAGYGAYGLNIGRSKSGTVGTNAAVTDGNDLGHITYYGADGSTFLKASMITSQVDGTPSSGMPGRLVFKTSPNGSGTPEERLRITSAGQLLHTRSDNTTRYDLEFRNTGGISDGNYGGIHWTQGSTGSTNLGAIEIEYADTGRPDIVFKTRQSGGTAMSEAARITSTGRVNIGQASDVDHTLCVAGTDNTTSLTGGHSQGIQLQNKSTTDSTYSQIEWRTAAGGRYARIAGIQDDANGNGGQLVFLTETSGGTTTEKLRMNAAGQLTIPQQPTFNAKLSTHTSAGFTGILVFNTVDYNIGSHYNNSNGKFTAPIDGRYLFAWYTNVERTAGNGSVWGDWYVNGSPRNNRFYTHHSGAWELLGGTIILDLNANDYLQVYVGVGGKYDGSSYGSFSGTLLG